MNEQATRDRPVPVTVYQNTGIRFERMEDYRTTIYTGTRIWFESPASAVALRDLLNRWIESQEPGR